MKSALLLTTTFAVVLASTTLTFAAGNQGIDPKLPQNIPNIPIVQQQPPLKPFNPGGFVPYLPGPVGGNSGGSSDASGDSSFSPDGMPSPKARPRIEVALVCDVTDAGNIVFTNIGDNAVPKGARIKWSAGGHKGFIGLRGALGSGDHATAADLINPGHGDIGCSAKAL